MKRLLATAGAVLLLSIHIFSAAYIDHEADHECCGDDCPVCVQLQQCIGNFQLAGSGVDAVAAPCVAAMVAAEPVVPVEAAPQNRSLVALKVQFNE